MKLEPAEPLFFANITGKPALQLKELTQMRCLMKKSADTVEIGTAVQAEGNPSRDGSNSIGWRSLKTMDGNDVGP